MEVGNLCLPAYLSISEEKTQCPPTFSKAIRVPSIPAKRLMKVNRLTWPPISESKASSLEFLVLFFLMSENPNFLG